MYVVSWEAYLIHPVFVTVALKIVYLYFKSTVFIFSNSIVKSVVPLIQTKNQFPHQTQKTSYDLNCFKVIEMFVHPYVITRPSWITSPWRLFQPQNGHVYVVPYWWRLHFVSFCFCYSGLWLMYVIWKFVLFWTGFECMCVQRWLRIKRYSG